MKPMNVIRSGALQATPSRRKVPSATWDSMDAPGVLLILTPEEKSHKGFGQLLATAGNTTLDA